MNTKITLIRTGAELIIFESVKSIVNPAVDSIAPDQTKLHKKLLAKIGTYAISAAITHTINKEIGEIIDNIVEAKELYKGIKQEGMELTKNTVE